MIQSILPPHSIAVARGADQLAMRVRVDEIDGRVTVAVAVEVKVEADLPRLPVQLQQLVLQALQHMSTQNDASGGRRRERESKKRSKDVSDFRSEAHPLLLTSYFQVLKTMFHQPTSILPRNLNRNITLPRTLSHHLQPLLMANQAPTRITSIPPIPRHANIPPTTPQSMDLILALRSLLNQILILTTIRNHMMAGMTIQIGERAQSM